MILTLNPLVFDLMRTSPWNAPCIFFHWCPKWTVGEAHMVKTAPSIKLPKILVVAYHVWYISKDKWEYWGYMKYNIPYYQLLDELTWDKHLCLETNWMQFFLYYHVADEVMSFAFKWNLFCVTFFSITLFLM